jgi:hypothetical protein
MQRIAYTLATLLLTASALCAAEDTADTAASVADVPATLDAAALDASAADTVIVEAVSAAEAQGSIESAIADEAAVAAALDAAALDAVALGAAAPDPAAGDSPVASEESVGADAVAAVDAVTSADDAAADVEAPVAAAKASDTTVALASQMEDIKRELVELKRDLVVLEEDLLYPASSQVAVFLSMDVGEFFALDSVTLKLNGKNVTHYLYTEKQTDALFRGGVQRLYVGNVKQGENQLTAFFTGRGPEGRDYSRAATVTFEKSFEPSYVELTISDSTAKYQPEFVATVSP